MLTHRYVGFPSNAERTLRIGGKWPVRGFVVLSAALAIGQVAASPPTAVTGVAGALLVILGIVGLLFLSILWLWNERAGVRLTPEGVRSVGVSGTRVISWDAINAVEIVNRGPLTLVGVRLTTGELVELSPTKGWAWQREAVEQIHAEVLMALDRVKTAALKASAEASTPPSE